LFYKRCKGYVNFPNRSLGSLQKYVATSDYASFCGKTYENGQKNAVFTQEPE
jgi:hypothetical protein